MLTVTFANLKLTFNADYRVEPNIEDLCAYADFIAPENFNDTDKARCRKLLMLKIDPNQHAGQLQIELLVGHHQYHRLLNVSDLASPPASRSPPWPSCSLPPFLSGKGKLAESAVEVLLWFEPSSHPWLQIMTSSSRVFMETEGWLRDELWACLAYRVWHKHRPWVADASASTTASDSKSTQGEKGRGSLAVGPWVNS